MTQDTTPPSDEYLRHAAESYLRPDSAQWPRTLKMAQGILRLLDERDRYHDKLLWFQVTKDEEREIEYANQGADSAADRLLAIIHGKAHLGRFGGEKLEEAAQAIHRLLTERDHMRQVVEAARSVSANEFGSLKLLRQALAALDKSTT